MTSDRIDVLLVAQGLARSRAAAAAALAAGRVLVDGTRVTRPSTRVARAAAVTVEAGPDWVGRAAGKLDAGLDRFRIDVRGRLALDLGASTGGFTQVLLDRGARAVVALDIGHGQLVPELRENPRVVVVEGENARSLTVARLAELAGTTTRPDVVVADLSFISLTLVLPAIAAVAAPDADVVCLIKPQFEVGRTRLRGGVVRDTAARTEAVRAVLDRAWALGLRTVDLAPSAVPGLHGNREALVHLHRARGRHPAEWTRSMGEVVVGPEGETR